MGRVIDTTWVFFCTARKICKSNVMLVRYVNPPSPKPLRHSSAQCVFEFETVQQKIARN